MPLNGCAQLNRRQLAANVVNPRGQTEIQYHKRNLALASLTAPYGNKVTDDLWVEIYVLKELKWDKQMVPAKIVSRPFFDHPRRRATPPGDS